MFAGSPGELGVVAEFVEGGIWVRAVYVLQGLRVGYSLSVNGVRLQVRQIVLDPEGSALLQCDDGSFRVDLESDTLRTTNLGDLRVGEGVNLERAALRAGRPAGYRLRGRIDGIATIDRIWTEEWSDRIFHFAAPPGLIPAIRDSGVAGLDGVAATIRTCDELGFSIAVDRHKNWDDWARRLLGEHLNLELVRCKS